jgi:EmrB/QacA subfamily drug resistance transporter
MTTGQSLRQSRLLLLLCVSVPSFMINLDGNIVAVSLPSIARALHADFASIEWVISAYTLPFAALVMPAGALADRFGRKRILLIGLAFFTLASLACGASPTAAILNTARAVQGVGAALLLSAALALLSAAFQGPGRAAAFAFWGSVIGIGITLGPLVGGVLTQTLGWEWAFYVNVPVGAVMFALSVFAVPESKDPDSAKLDWWGFGFLASSLFLLTYALISGNHRGWSDRLVVTSLTWSVALFGAFIVVEKKQARPMLDLAFFKVPTYVGANLAGLTYAAALLTMLTFLPLYFQGGMDISPIAAGLMMLPMALPLFVVPRIVSRYLDHRFSGRALLTIGLGLVSLGLTALAVLASGFHAAPMMAWMAVAGIGAGILNGETAKVGLSVIPPSRAGMAAGVGGTVRFAGIVVGFAALGALLYQKVASTLVRALPCLSPGQLHAATGDVVAGNLHAAAQLGAGAMSVMVDSFASGYQWVFGAAALVAAFGALASWTLVAPVIMGEVSPSRATAVAGIE